MVTNNKLLNCPHLRFPEFKDEWQQTTLGEVGEIRMCKRILANQTNKEGGVPFFKIGTIGKKEDSYISETLFQEYKSKYHYPNKGQILITCAGTIGRCIIFDGSDAYYQDSNIVWIDNEESQITNPYLFYLLNRTDWSRLNTSTIVRLYNDDLRALPIPLPSLPEQKKIASFLSLLDERIEVQRQTIKERKNQKKALLHQLFSQSLRFPEFSDEWKPCIIKDFGEVITGGTPPTSDPLNYSPSKYLWASPGDLGNTKYLYKTKTLISEKGLSTLRSLPKGSILVTCIGLIGKMGIATEKLASNQQINAVIVFDTFSNEYVYYAIHSRAHRFQTMASTQVVPILSKREFEKLPSSYPSLPEQEKIASFLSLLDERIELEEKLLQKYEEQKRYLLRKMFV